MRHFRLLHRQFCERKLYLQRLSIFLNGSYGNKVLNYNSINLTHMNSAWINQLNAVGGRAKLVPIDADKVYEYGNWYDDITNVRVANAGTRIPRASINDPNDNDRISDPLVATITGSTTRCVKLYCLSVSAMA